MREPITLHVTDIKPDATSLEAPYFQGKRHHSSLALWMSGKKREARREIYCTLEAPRSEVACSRALTLHPIPYLDWRFKISDRTLIHINQIVIAHPEFLSYRWLKVQLVQCINWNVDSLMLLSRVSSANSLVCPVHQHLVTVCVCTETFTLQL